MKKIRELVYLISIAVLFLGFLYIAPPVAASGILVTPMGQTIDAPPSTNFTLNFKMIFNEDDEGYFVITLYWDNNETAPEPEKSNFTYQDLAAKFTDGTPFSGSIGVSITKAIPYGYPQGYYRYMVSISATYGETYGNQINPKEFWLNVTMRSAGLKNGVYYPHTSGNQDITISKVRCYEYSQISRGPGDVTIRVVAPEIMSCDSAGNPKDAFNVTLGEAVYVKGYGFNSSATIRLYVVPNATWADAQSIGSDIRGDYNTTSADTNGNLTVTRLGILPNGYYDIVADVNMNGQYDPATDAVDDVSISPGITVIPEFPYGIAMVIATLTLIMFVAYTKKRNPSLFQIAKLR